MSAALKVTLLTQPATTYEFLKLNDGTKFNTRVVNDFEESDADEVVEFAGRACYQSWDTPNPKTATNEGYISNILAQEHFSVLEHASFTFYIEGVSRSLTHELVRHRHLSFSQLSQRYVDQSELNYVIPPALRGNEMLKKQLHINWLVALNTYDAIVDEMVQAGAKRKEARQAARAVLPEMTETKIVVTGNGSSWRHFLQKRNHPAADAEIRELAQEIQRQLIEVAPNLFKDLEALNG